MKDRNGNYLTVTYHWWGQINQITDTLGRILTFNYDSDQKLTSITQPWSNGVHQWAAFEYQDLNLTVPGHSQAVGAKNGQVWPVLQRVTLADGGYHTFTYGASGQVNNIAQFAADDHELNHLNYKFGGTLADRVEHEYLTAQDWASDVVTLYAAPEAATWTLPYNNEPQSGFKSVITAPDGVESRLYFGATGWQRGLGLFTETVAEGTVQRWTATAWAADTGGINPRVIESNVGDPQGNRRRTTISYTSYGLPADVREYAADATTLYRSSHTDYLLTDAYTAPGPNYGRILGLLLTQYVCDGSIGLTGQCDDNSGPALAAKVSYKYDDAAWTEHLQAPPAAALQHDATHFGASFKTRGNLYEVTRWDVTAPTTNNLAVQSETGYYTTGTPRFTRQKKISNSSQWDWVMFDYTDQFSDGNNTPVSYNTFAYPTQVTDPDGFTAQSEYRYDFGAPVKASGPPPAGQSQGAIVRRQYDALGRLEKVRTEFNGNPDYRYTRWTYPVAQNSVNQFTTITAGAGEAYSFSLSDGAGRTRLAVTEHPGSVGGYSTVATEYDLLGRAFKQSVPTETDANTIPAGDDAAGYLYRTQTFDWQGRPLVTTNTDGTQTEASYGGCGCAGGAIVTLTGEQLAEGRRRQKIYSDNLGRTYKTEVLNYNHTASQPSVYAATVTEYNARDQVRFVKQYAGAATADGSCLTGTCQQSETQYDGHGRTWRSHTPEMDAGAWQSVAYNTNDTVHSRTDARGATVNYQYNARRLVTQVSYTSPNATTVPATANFFYDALGNRTQMNDGAAVGSSKD